MITEEFPLLYAYYLQGLEEKTARGKGGAILALVIFLPSVYMIFSDEYPADIFYFSSVLCALYLIQYVLHIVRKKRQSEGWDRLILRLQSSSSTSNLHDIERELNGETERIEALLLTQNYILICDELQFGKLAHLDDVVRLKMYVVRNRHIWDAYHEGEILLCEIANGDSWQLTTDMETANIMVAEFALRRPNMMFRDINGSERPITIPTSTGRRPILV